MITYSKKNGIPEPFRYCILWKKTLNQITKFHPAVSVSQLQS